VLIYQLSLTFKSIFDYRRVELSHNHNQGLMTAKKPGAVTYQSANLPTMGLFTGLI